MSTQSIKTVEGYHFHSCGLASKKQTLFAVVPGVSDADALEAATDLLNAIRSPIFAAAMGEQPLQDNQAWLVLRALDSAIAVIDSLQRAAEIATPSRGQV